MKKSENKTLELLDKINLSSIFENTTDSVWAINTDYEILYANQIFVSAFLVSFGIKLEQGTNLLISLPKTIQKVWKGRYDRALNNESFSFIDNVSTENLSLFIEVFMNPIVIDEKVVGALFFGKDITQRKLDEIELKNSKLVLQKSEKELKELNATKDKLFSIIGHDLRSPFNSIIGLSDVLIDKVNDSSFNEKEKYLRHINNSANQTLILLDNLLNWAKSQSGTLSVNIENMILSDIILEVVSLKKSLPKLRTSL